MSAKRANPILWQHVLDEVKNGNLAGPAGTWNARKAQLAVALYKKRGGTYVGPPQTTNKLAIWTKEDWGYVDGKPGNRYLPKEVRDKLTPSQKRAENAAKKRATAEHKQYAQYAKTETAHAVMNTKAKTIAKKLERKSKSKSRSKSKRASQRR